ncbi:hypothetical protein C8N32_105173 [Rhodovulum imhoffii]|uniref:Uncharacterized protein n=1 Tax=Rhodovulum imhoffii TaxID=365340 RepID=A0A2T5BTP7_9RHOB|nr:hypothetical protein C8N32_105173 [Rhodovulum imhoffii]
MGHSEKVNIWYYGIIINAEILLTMLSFLCIMRAVNSV